MLLVDVLRSNVAAGKFQLHDFVIMPDHLHLLMTLGMPDSHGTANVSRSAALRSHGQS
jgi:REP element-mobilizing transposase RayT